MQATNISSTRSVAPITPEDEVRCSAAEHAENPAHEAWIVGNDGETYCAGELGRLRNGPAPHQPLNAALMRAQKEYRPDSDDWHRHLEDVISRDWYEAPVITANLETYSLESILGAIAHGTFVDPRRANQPLRAPLYLLPNRAVQRLAAKTGAFELGDKDPYVLPQCRQEQIDAARRAYAELCLFENEHPVEALLMERGKYLLGWHRALEQARRETAIAIAAGAPQLMRQYAELVARAQWAESPGRLFSSNRTCHMLACGQGAAMGAILEMLLRPSGGLPGIFIAVAVASLASYYPARAFMAAKVPVEGGIGEHMRKNVLFAADHREALQITTTLNGVVTGATVGVALGPMFIGSPRLQTTIMGAILGGMAAFMSFQVTNPETPTRAFHLVRQTTP